MKEHSPFTPGRPVPVEFFVGRREEIERLQRAIRQAAHRNENIFLTGERGIGKSSLADFVQFLAEKDHLFFGVHCYVGPATTLEEICQAIVRAVVQEMGKKDLLERARGVFGRYIENVQVNLFGLGVKVELTKDPRELRDLALDFLPTLRRLYGTISDRKRGLLLILDDLNGATKVPEFALFLKSLVDQIASEHGNPFPLLLMLVGVQERMSDMMAHQPSVGRIFDLVELNRMSDQEANDFFHHAYDSVGTTVEESALSLLVEYAGGFPMLLHEVGDAVYWEDIDNHIDEQDARQGIMQAAENVGRKYLDRQVYQELRSKTYRSILRRIVPSPVAPSVIRRSEVLPQMSAREQKSFDHFLRRMEKLGVLKRGEARGEYVFTNELFRLYIFLESLAAESR